MRLGLIFFLLAVPMLEIGLLIKAGQWLGPWWLLALVIGTGFLGALVLTRQGFSAPLKIQEAMLRGEPPVAAMLDGALIATAGVLLFTPGLMADAIGLLLLIPPLRRLIARASGRWFFGFAVVDTPGQGPRRSTADASTRTNSGPVPERSAAGGPVIEGEFERIDERTLDPNRRKPGGGAQQ